MSSWKTLHSCMTAAVGTRPQLSRLPKLLSTISRFCTSSSKLQPVPKKQAKKDQALQRLQGHAASLGGHCLSAEYLNNHTKMRWQCREGHTWLATSHSVLVNESWCPECAWSRARLGLHRLKDHAQTLGGQCLATAYTSCRAKVGWRCRSGHEWYATPTNVLHNKSWCPECANESKRGTQKGQQVRRKLTLQDMHDHAAKLGGRCLASHYESVKAKLSWQCKHGHTWKAMASNVLYRNSWCPQCAVTGPLGIKPLQDHAAALGGQCLAVEYKNVKFTVMWRCSNGHEWQATPKNVLHSGSWCPKCAKNAPIGLQRVQDHAISLGGQCLTTTYRNSHQKLTWTCRFGHSWSASAGSVLYNGSWCPTCAATIWKTEAEVRRIFETIFFPAAFDSCFPDFLAGLQLDGYCAAMRLAFEYHGEQHYDADSYFHSRDPTSFKRQQERDAAKVERCQRAGVRLMVVPYFVRDKWTFVKLALLQWFTIARVNPIMLSSH